jgi:hypothetical protein
MFMLAIVGLGVAGTAYVATLRHVARSEAARSPHHVEPLREGYVRRGGVMPAPDPNQPRPAPPAPMRRAGIELPYGEKR